MPRSTSTLMEPMFQLARRTPFNIAPERGEELSKEIFGKARWRILASGGKASFDAYPTETTVSATYSGLASLWCVAYVGFNFIDIASRMQRRVDRSQTHMDIGESCALLRLGEYLAYARSLFKFDSYWPSALQTPDVHASLSSSAGLVNNIFFGALSWILLHEIGHVHLAHEIHIPADQRIRQEFQADDFATRWVLDDSGNGVNREFRALMICVALAWLFMNEETIGRDKVHPPAIVRFKEATSKFCLGTRSVALENVAYLFKAIFDPETSPPIFDSPEESFAWISERLTVLFPR